MCGAISSISRAVAVAIPAVTFHEQAAAAYARHTAAVVTPGARNGWQSYAQHESTTSKLQSSDSTPSRASHPGPGMEPQQGIGCNRCCHEKQEDRRRCSRIIICSSSSYSSSSVRDATNHRSSTGSCGCSVCTAVHAATAPTAAGAFNDTLAAAVIDPNARALVATPSPPPHAPGRFTRQPTRGSFDCPSSTAAFHCTHSIRVSASSSSPQTTSDNATVKAACATRPPRPSLFYLLAALLLATSPAVVLAVRTSDHKAEPLGTATLLALYPNHPWDIPVTPSDIPLGPTRTEAPHVPFYSVQTDNDQLQLYDENLELDLAPWRRRNRSEMTVGALLDWAARLPPMASQRVVMIKGGRVALLQQKNGSMLDCERPCDIVLNSLLKDLRSWVAASPSDWPDVVFFLNTADTSLCQQHETSAAAATSAAAVTGVATAFSRNGSSSSNSSKGGGGRRRSKSSLGRCPVPVLSVIKEWDRHKDEDILVPVTLGMHGWAPLHYFPWRNKIERAVFRGREYCHTRGYAYAKGVCSRTYMALMTQYQPDWADLVDVGLVDNYTLLLPNRTAVRIAGRGFVNATELARFRYVLALDGITASYRLARLLSFNSVVLKQASPWIEWYYRSLVPGMHYVSIWNYHRADVLHVIRGLRHKGRYLYDIATHAQAFAYRYLTPNARRLYWLRVLREYRKLFGDMDDFLAGQEIPEAQPGGA